MKHYINGFDRPMFIIMKLINGTFTPVYHTIKFPYDGLTEYLDEKYVEHELIDGSNEQTFLWAHYEWDLMFQKRFVADNAVIIRDILNSQQLGYPIILFPHSDNYRRAFVVVTKKEKIGFGMHFGGIHSGGNKDFKISFKTKYPLTLASNPGGTVNWTTHAGGTTIDPGVEDNTPLDSPGSVINFLGSTSETILVTHDNSILLT